MLLIHDSLCPKEVRLDYISQYNDYFNIVSCDLFSDKRKCYRIRLFAVYVVPGVSVDTLKCLLDILSMHIDSFNGSSIICGDFNLPNINWDLGASLGDNRHDLFYRFF